MYACQIVYVFIMHACWLFLVMVIVAIMSSCRSQCSDPSEVIKFVETRIATDQLWTGGKDKWGRSHRWHSSNRDDTVNGGIWMDTADKRGSSYRFYTSFGLDRHCGHHYYHPYRRSEK